MLPIDIIGGGFSGTMALYHLMQKDGLPPLDVRFYDAAGAHGRGVAYGTPFPEHLLNVPADGMSALPDQPGHFMHWIGQDAQPKAFYPRRRYGDYLSAFLQQALIDAARKGHQINIVSAHATPDPQKITIIATGTSAPKWPKGTTDVQDGVMIPHPYGDAFKDFLSHHEQAKSVVILGTGLSAADAVLSLAKAGFTGKIIALSRRGLWPLSHGPKTKLWHWRKHIDALRPHSNTIWRRLPEAVRKWALSKLTYWNVVRHRMPPECHAIFSGLRASGRLITRKAAVTGVHAQNGKAIVDTSRGPVGADVVINCMGHVTPASAAIPASEGRLRIGAAALFALGPPLFGHYIETTAVPELKMQAKQVADEVADYILKEKSHAFS